MAKKDRTKELWHIPKRCSVHQTIGITEILSLPEFYQKAWNHGKQEAVGTKLGQWGLTTSGKPITGQAIRTLLALPKYLGFVYVDKKSIPSKIITTDIGFELIKEHSLQGKVRKNLLDYKKNKELVEISPVFQFQMIKLQITNPAILSDCENIFVFPFRATLSLLLNLEYLDIEELAYIVFSMKNQEELGAVKERIINFRSLPSSRRDAEIGAFRKTSEGQLTLVKAPSAGYYISLCLSTGLCKKKIRLINGKKLITLELTNKKETEDLLVKFKDIRTFDFDNDMDLWISYIANPKRFYPPQNVDIVFNNTNSYLVTVHQGNEYIAGDAIDENKKITCPLFFGEEYLLEVYDMSSGDVILNKKITSEKNKSTISVILPKTNKKTKRSIDNIIQSIGEMFGKEKFDEEYRKKLKIINDILGLNYDDNRRRGGRLEYLFFELLIELKNKGIIDDVFWYGKKAKYGICEPAPGGKNGNPDVTFSVDNNIVVLELTTIPGVRAQWNSSEASSVPDHILKFKNNNPSSKVLGVFSAPSIHHQLKKNLERNSTEDDMKILALPIEELCDLFRKSDRKSLLSYIENYFTK